MAGELPDSKEISKEISNNISEEYVTCGAYFGIAAGAVRRSGDDETAKKMEEARDSALQYALLSAKEGRTQELAEKVTLSRLDLNMKSMTKEIANDIGNISILINQYADRCKEIMEDPDKMMSEWSDKILKKYHLK